MGGEIFLAWPVVQNLILWFDGHEPKGKKLDPEMGAGVREDRIRGYIIYPRNTVKLGPYARIRIGKENYYG